MEHPHQLNPLSDREAVADAMYRVLIGMDRNDAAIFDSAWAGEDVSVEFPDHNMSLNSLSDIHKHILDSVGPMDTSFMTSNIRVNIKDDGKSAYLTAYCLGQHSPPGRGQETDGPKYCVGGEYGIDLVKHQDGLWKIKKWRMEVLWKQGDPSVIGQ